MIVTRFAPSPTGLLHLGNYRTALFAYIFALQNSGKFILRIEDTDKARSKKEYEENIIESLKWLGLEYSGFYRQSERGDVYSKYIQQLIDTGHAFVSKEVVKQEGDREEVIRFKNPNKKIKFSDIIRGDIEFDTTELGDFVIARSMTEPIFHLVVVVDDHDMNVTHIIRGEDHISNTPRHILIQEALGFTSPHYAHVPLLLSPDKSKLSKRKGALPITHYRDAGYLKEAMINYLALLGWNPGTEQEIFTIDELVKAFDLSQINKSGAMVSDEKLRWLNKQYINKLSIEKFKEQVKGFMPDNLSLTPEVMRRLLPFIKERIHTLGEIKEVLSPQGELHCVVESPTFSKEKLLWKKDTDLSIAKYHLAYIVERLENLTPEEFHSPDSIKASLWSYAEEKGRGSVLWPMRYALSGQDKSPDPFELAYLLGQEETNRRLTKAHDLI